MNYTFMLTNKIAHGGQTVVVVFRRRRSLFVGINRVSVCPAGGAARTRSAAVHPICPRPRTPPDWAASSNRAGTGPARTHHPQPVRCCELGDIAGFWSRECDVSGDLVVSTSDCSERGRRVEPALQTVSAFFTKITAIRSVGQGLNTYCKT